MKAMPPSPSSCTCVHIRYKSTKFINRRLLSDCQILLLPPTVLPNSILHSFEARAINMLTLDLHGFFLAHIFNYQFNKFLFPYSPQYFLVNTRTYMLNFHHKKALNSNIFLCQTIDIQVKHKPKQRAEHNTTETCMGICMVFVWTWAIEL